MNRLRVLTGRHAGTDLLLPEGRYVLSAESDADIRLLDWTGDALVLHIQKGSNNVSSAEWQFTDAVPGEVVIDLMPRQFGGLGLCFGPEDVSLWPGDMTLLDRLLRPGRPPASLPSGAGAGAGAEKAGDAEAASGETPRTGTWRGRPWLMFAATAGVALLAGTFTAVVSGVVNDAAAKVPPPSPLALAQRAVTAAQVNGVVVRARAGGAIVEGLLATPAEAAQLSAALDPLPRGLVLRRYAAATEVAQSIAESLDEPGVSVKYLGSGEFVIEGSAVRAERLRVAADRVVADLAPLVRSIRLNVADIPPPPRTPVGAMLASSGMTYVQTRDGTKHLTLSNPPVEELKDSDLGTPPTSATDGTVFHSPRSLR